MILLTYQLSLIEAIALWSLANGCAETWEVVRSTDHVFVYRGAGNRVQQWERWSSTLWHQCPPVRIFPASGQHAFRAIVVWHRVSKHCRIGVVLYSNLEHSVVETGLLVECTLR